MQRIFIEKLDEAIPWWEDVSRQQLQGVFFDLHHDLCPSFPAPAFRDAYLTFLDGWIMTHRMEITAFVRRVNLHFAAREGEACFGALIDLFIILGEKGYDLRRSLLLRVSPLFSPEQKAFLQERLSSGIDAKTPIPCAALHSRLTKGLSTGIAVISREKIERRTSGMHSAAEEAFARLEDGQIDEAMALFTLALREDPGNIEVLDTLLDIYRRSEDLDAFRALGRDLEGSGVETAPVWVDTINHFIRSQGWDGVF